MEKLLVLVILLGLAVLVFKLRGDAAKERKAVMARLAAERDERGDYSPTAELFREVGVHHVPDAPLPRSFPTAEFPQPARAEAGADLPDGFPPAFPPAFPPMPADPSTIGSAPAPAAAEPEPAAAAPVSPAVPDPEFAGRDAGFARTGRQEPEPGDLRTLFKGISMPAGLRPLGPLVPITASFVTEASPAEVHAGLEAEFERLDCVANWVEPTVAQTERNGMRGIVTIYPNPAALTDLDGTPLFPGVAPGHVVVKMLAL